ncbi:hypothetical protein HPB50_010621 [Hyalomma asiaticum]|uniref:Uncharacterized protein n=1 Tax=Hyalomma asiaticum TaxID=266040 RepID=A0ACB7S287_HYAAI|nr:hypothetical protein HPB50_010621 [Hyalomma asiaticum]
MCSRLSYCVRTATSLDDTFVRYVASKAPSTSAELASTHLASAKCEERFEKLHSCLDFTITGRRSSTSSYGSSATLKHYSLEAVHSISLRAGACTLAVYVPEFSSRTSPRLGRMHRHQSSPSVMASSSRQMEHRYKSYVVGSQHLFEQAPAYWPSIFEISSRASPPAAEHYYLNPPSVILSSWKHWTLPLPRGKESQGHL